MNSKFKKDDYVSINACDGDFCFDGVIIDVMYHNDPSYAVYIPNIDHTAVCSEDQLTLIA